jgi:hypothetical protein
MAEHDPLSDLDSLARMGEQYATPPLPAGEVRARGTRRRHRRQATMAVATACVAIAIGGVALNGTSFRVDERPSPAGTPAVSASPSPAATRQLTEQDLITAAEYPLDPNFESVVVREDGDRKPAQLSVCQAGTPKDLGARQALPRHFMQDRSDSPPGRSPDVYTLTLQFDDASAARQALDTYTQWLRTCSERLSQQGYEMLRPARGEAPERIPIDAGAVEGSAYELVYREPGGPADSGTFENVGLLRVEDRLMVLVRVVQGQDDNAYYWDEPVEGMAKHPFYELMSVAARKLA